MATIRQVRRDCSYFAGFKLHSGQFVFLLQLCVCFLCCGVIQCEDYCTGIFSRCNCTDDYVECHNETTLTDITKLYPYIKDHVTKVIITGSNFQEVVENFLGSCHLDSSLRLVELKTLNISNNNISRIHGKSFHCMPNLENLTISENMWQIDFHTKETGYFTNLPKLKHLDLTNAFDEVWNGSIHFGKLASVFTDPDKPMTALVTLKLAHNEFFTFSEPIANSFCELPALQFLDLSHNNFVSPSLPTKDNCLENLQTLDLTYNSMPRIPNEFLMKVASLKDLKEVHLEHNSFYCDCGLLETWNWLNNTTVPVVNKNDMKCAGGYHSSYIDKQILSLQPSDLKCLMAEAPSNTAVKAVTGIIFTVIGLTIVGLMFVNRAKLRLMFKRWKKRMPNINLRMHTGYSTVQEVAVVNTV